MLSAKSASVHILLDSIGKGLNIQKMLIVKFILPNPVLYFDDDPLLNKYTNALMHTQYSTLLWIFQLQNSGVIIRLYASMLLIELKVSLLNRE